MGKSELLLEYHIGSPRGTR